MEQQKRKLGNPFYIGLLSFFGGISQDLIVPILPLYLTNVLHIDKSFFGAIEGVVNSSASIFKVASGFLSDKFRTRKKIVFVGYLLSLISRPLLALVTSGYSVMALRFLDGVGKGIKDSPKDALIADSTVQETRGKQFGVVRALDTFGSVIGPLCLFGLLYLLKNSASKYEAIFFISAVPLTITLLILALKVKEVKVESSGRAPSLTRLGLPRAFYAFLGIVVVFSIGNSSDTFLILRCQNLGVAVLAIPLVYALFNLCYALASVPLGSLSDRIGREKVLLIGWITYSLAYLGFALADKSYQAWVLFAFYGLYYATSEGVAKAMVADIVPREKRGTAYGLYNTAVGLMTLPASLTAGLLWDRVSSAAPFFFGAAMSVSASGLLALMLLARSRQDRLSGA